MLNDDEELSEFEDDDSKSDVLDEIIWKDGKIPELTVSMIDALKAKGFSQSAIARGFGVSRQAVSWHVITYDGARTPRQAVLESWPFEVPAKMGQMAPCRNLRNHGEYLVTSGRGMSEDSLKRLRAFYKKLRDENTVVEFDPEIPPIPGVSSEGGWAFRGRVPADGDLLIRVNKHTRLEGEARKIWRFPRKDP